MEVPEKPSGTGHFFLLIDPQRLLGTEAYNQAMARFQHLIRSTAPADPDQPVQLPGEREQARRREALAQGVEIPAKLMADLEALASG